MEKFKNAVEDKSIFKLHSQCRLFRFFFDFLKLTKRF